MARAFTQPSFVRTFALTILAIGVLSAIDLFLARTEREANEAEAARFYANGVRLMQAGKSAEAADQFQSALSLERENEDYQLALAQALDAARQQHAAMLAERSIQPRTSPLNTAWQSVGPISVSTPAYGSVSGRVTSIAIDPADSTGNTIYVGTTGGGVWKSVNAAGPASAVTFTPLTDTLPVFSASLAVFLSSGMSQC